MSKQAKCLKPHHYALVTCALSIKDEHDCVGCDGVFMGERQANCGAVYWHMSWWRRWFRKVKADE